MTHDRNTVHGPFRRHWNTNCSRIGHDSLKNQRRRGVRWRCVAINTTKAHFIISDKLFCTICNRPLTHPIALSISRSMGRFPISNLRFLLHRSSCHSAYLYRVWVRLFFFQFVCATHFVRSAVIESTHRFQWIAGPCVQLRLCCARELLLCCHHMNNLNKCLFPVTLMYSYLPFFFSLFIRSIGLRFSFITFQSVTSIVRWARHACRVKLSSQNNQITHWICWVLLYRFDCIESLMISICEQSVYNVTSREKKTQHFFMTFFFKCYSTPKMILLRLFGIVIRICRHCRDYCSWLSGMNKFPRGNEHWHCCNLTQILANWQPPHSTAHLCSNAFQRSVAEFNCSYCTCNHFHSCHIIIIILTDGVCALHGVHVFATQQRCDALRLIHP